MGNKTKYTPTEAIEAVRGLHRKKLYTMMKNGDISYERQDKNRLLDASELARVFGGDFVFQETPETFPGNTLKQIETPEKHAGNRPLEVEVALLRERLTDKDSLIRDKDRIIDDIRSDRDHWRSQAQTLLLTDQRSLKAPEKPAEAQSPIAETPPTATPTQPSQRAFFGWLGVGVVLVGGLTGVATRYEEVWRGWLERIRPHVEMDVLPQKENRQKHRETAPETVPKQSPVIAPPQQSFPITPL